jgi:hypothetical protein
MENACPFGKRLRKHSLYIKLKFPPSVIQNPCFGARLMNAQLIEFEGIPTAEANLSVETNGHFLLFP